MKKTAFILLLCGILFSGCSGAENNGRQKIILTGQELDGEKIVYDEESGVSYVSDQLLITFADSVTRAEAVETIHGLGAEVVGEISVINKYQAELPQAIGYAGLNEKIAVLKQDPKIIDANINQVMLSPAAAADKVNDSQWQGEWNDDGRVGGKNWYIEAVKAQKAWDYSGLMQDIDIGVFEAEPFIMYDDEVHFEEPVLNNEDTIENHGLAVSMVLAGKMNNSLGTCGVMPNAKIHGAVYKTVKDKNNILQTDAYSQEVLFAYLVCAKNCRVINCSYGYSLLGFAANEGDTVALADSFVLNNELQTFFGLLLDNGYDFLIVKASGNTENTTFIKDKDEEYGFRNEGDWDFFNRYRGNTDPSYDALSGITDERVKAHILVVGASRLTEQESVGGKYAISSFSTGQDKFTDKGGRVDITAPGEDIYVYYGGKDVLKGAGELLPDEEGSNYVNESGTSFAAPVASGIAGMIYGINPELTGSEVKKIICSNTYSEVKMPDAELCVKAAIASLEKTHIRTIDVNNTPDTIKEERQKEIINAYNTDGTEYKDYIGRWVFKNEFMTIATPEDTYLNWIGYINVESADENRISGQICEYVPGTDELGEVTVFNGTALDEDSTITALYGGKCYLLDTDKLSLNKKLYLTDNMLVTCGGGAVSGSWVYYTKSTDRAERVPRYMTVASGWTTEKEDTSAYYTIIETNDCIDAGRQKLVPMDAVFYGIAEYYNNFSIEGVSDETVAGGRIHSISLKDSAGNGSFTLSADTAGGVIRMKMDDIGRTIEENGAVMEKGGRIYISATSLISLFNPEERGWRSSYIQLYKFFGYTWNGFKYNGRVRPKSINYVSSNISNYPIKNTYVLALMIGSNANTVPYNGSAENKDS